MKIILVAIVLLFQVGLYYAYLNHTISFTHERHREQLEQIVAKKLKRVADHNQRCFVVFGESDHTDYLKAKCLVRFLSSQSNDVTFVFDESKNRKLLERSLSQFVKKNNVNIPDSALPASVVFERYDCNSAEDKEHSTKLIGGYDEFKSMVSNRYSSEISAFEEGKC